MSHNTDKEDVKVTGSTSNYLEEVKCDTDHSTKPFKCAVPSCTNRFQTFIESSLCPYKFHDFPKHPFYKKRWMTECGFNSSTNVNSLKVCSDHFDPEDYIEVKRKHSDYIRRLRFNAVPKKKMGNEIHEGIMKTNVELKRKYKELISEQKNLEQQILEYGKRSRHILVEISKLERTELSKKENIGKSLLSKVFSQAQIDILSGKDKVFWTDDDMARAFTVRHMSNKDTYKYLRNHLNIPLPSLASIQKWAASGNKDKS